VEQVEAGRSPAPAPALLAAPAQAATLAADGTAVAPASAPAPVKQIIAAGNEIHDKPYRYGGGHAKRIDSGYDCSGSMSYALQGAGLLKTALDSSGFAGWGEAGPGQWVTIYANAATPSWWPRGFALTRAAAGAAGSRWQASQRSSSGYTVRHPSGL